MKDTIILAVKSIGHKGRFGSIACIFVLLLGVLAGCGQNWQATIVTPNGDLFAVDHELLDDLTMFADRENGIPLERVFWTAGHYAIEQLFLVEKEGIVHEFFWADVADDAWWRDSGEIVIGDVTLSVERLEVKPPALLDEVQAHITDIAPAVASAMRLPMPALSGNGVLEVPDADQVLLLFLDGFGYVRYTEARDAGLIPNISTLPEPIIGLTEYPPSTRVGTASLLTGASSRINGVADRSTRSTEVETLFDVATSADLRVVTVEGDALAFNLRGTEIQLSGDRDGNGWTDDNVLGNTLSVLEEGMPDLFYVHFHGIDDAGHTYGPGAAEEQAVIAEVDAAVGEILDALPANTLIIIFADHGMHQVDEEEKTGNHGNLILRDMFIPIFILQK